ncbi:3-hydroxyacyl-CoA dehydrogenase NAD-binding domain-containing protein [Mesorhizobium sp. BAC0120]|uniref:3-hydroxyacyl-CoA dehydrogenase NAD-binding domain-containing protein n=1 Tax=Mesorhizobium sp. BAC0120 TaxID=3090670 RepID=UPI00298C67BA|nr:3-hydroxyacyl-CoA dehydrogenase NAD-binding domain-containing protein [Mesorhizobium sp. BAC0120]MDW6023389.1 3-hydroxyacyl-CoA dehydrogenase NAD-binding domain-containing protein [Mesorhizobium sp. BAC0120]
MSSETRINAVTTLAHSGKVAVIAVDAPPVNALSAAVRQGIAAGLAIAADDAAVAAVVLICAGKGFFAGADISEFGKPMAEPDLPTLADTIERFAKPVVAAIHGTALGGGFELAMACHARVATSSARMGLPEVKLGLIPGCGGCQRLTRLAGAKAALEMITSGNPISAGEAHSMGIVDSVGGVGVLREVAVAHAEALAGKPPRRTRDLDARIKEARADPALFKRFRAGNARRLRRQDAPDQAILSIEAGLTLPFDAAVRADTEAFDRLENGPQSAAMRHLFIAEREVRKVPGLPPDLEARNISRVGVVGAGTMGGGIAMAMANAGIPVLLTDARQEALHRGLATIRTNYERSLKSGRLSETELEARMELIVGVDDIEALSDCDLIIEAAFEDMEVKKAIFSRLDGVARADAILATNTSFLNVDEIAAVTSRPAQVLGLHFFSPANVMRLLEIVRGARTGADVLATAMALARRIGKTGVVVGVCHGFVGNRMLARRQRAANQLILEGALPWDVDRVLYDFGMPMGPFAMADLAGLDLGWTPERSTGSTMDELLCEAGRFGQKSGAGYYDYDASHKPKPAPIVEEMLAGLSVRAGVERRPVSDAEILDRCLSPMIEEGRKIIAEGIALRSSDVDVVWVHGYGWPAWTGGPMYWAEHGALAPSATPSAERPTSRKQQ